MADQPEVDVRLISAGYLHTMRMPVIHGRDFEESDAAGRPGVSSSAMRSRTASSPTKIP